MLPLVIQHLFQDACILPKDETIKGGSRLLCGHDAVSECTGNKCLPEL